MDTTRQDFQNNQTDFREVWNFLSSLSATEDNDWGWDFCRFEWWYFRIHAAKHTDQPEFFEKNVLVSMTVESKKARCG